ncbi:MAG: LTA synthase family protein [Pirellulales bacterium]
MNPDSNPNLQVTSTLPAKPDNLPDTATRPAAARRRAIRAADALRELAQFCAREPLWTGMMLVFIGVWTIELYWLQAVTLVYPNDTGARYAYWAPKIRLALDLLFITTLTLSLRRRWLFVAAIGSSLAYLGLLTYFKYFLKPLSLLTIMTNWREGLKVGGFAWDMYPRGAAALLLGALVVKLSALVLSRKASLPRPCAWTVAALVFAGYMSLLAVAGFVDPLRFIQTTRGVGRLGHIRGYLGPWFAEWYYLRGDELLNEVLEKRKINYDRLTPIEVDIPLHRRLVIMQVESLDTNILDYKVGDIEVTPFLNQLRRDSMYYRVRAMHWQGSADADFAALNGVAGSARANTYSIKHVPYANTTPQLLANCGYAICSFHGNSGDFYERRDAYEQMGFTEIYFRRELEEKFALPAERWGIQDQEVLRLSAHLLRQSTAPTCHFLITYTTHTPYMQLPAGEREIYPRPETAAQRYLNNMRYFDNCLRDYVTALGRGATVMLYADHPAEAFEGYESDRDTSRGLEFIPCMIYDTDQDLSLVQKTRDDPISTDGSLNLVDVVNYLRTQVKRNCQATKRLAEEATGVESPQ